jgi:pimeloyl-ACP methyl ester carboxylesterase
MEAIPKKVVDTGCQNNYMRCGRLRLKPGKIMKRTFLGLCFFILLGNQCLLAGLNDGLVAYYPFNGNANDASGNGHNGVNIGGQLCPDRFGNPSSAILFNGTDYIVVQDFTSIDLTSGFTFSAWVSPSSFAVALTRGVISQPRAITGTGYRLGFMNDHADVGLMASWDYPFDATETQVEETNTWIHIVATMNSSNVLLYVNGACKATITQNGWPYLHGPYPLYIGTEGIINEGDRSFRGAVDDVRIYNRALSASEIQQLYSMATIGTAPAAPTVMQTNRTPTSAEIGIQTSGSFKVFTNGNFVSGVALDPSKKTIVLTHGWNDNPTTWPWLMAETLQFELGPSTFNIVAWDWRTNAQSVLPWTAAANTPKEGRAFGVNLLAALGVNYSKPIHFIGHSFGTLVNAGAANYLEANGYSWTNIQMTLFDEAEVGSGSVSNTFQTAASTITAILANDSGPQPFWYHPLPTNCAWADNYITAFGMLHSNAANVILTNDFPIATILPQAAYDEIVAFHGYPMTWYDDSITTPFGSSLGFRRSFEENGLTPPPATNTFFIQAFSSSDLDLAATSFSSASQLLNTRLKNMLNPIYYSLVQAAPGPLQAAGQINTGIQDTLTQDPYAFTTGLPEAWGINVNLATSSSSGGSSPMPQIKAQPLGLTPKGGSSPTNVPAFVWIPLAVPSNAVSLSFDFMFQGDGASDSFAAALNGTNLFSLETSLIQTNVTMNSGQIAVSQYAGTNAELFLGIVGGTSTNANVTVSGLRFYSIVAPSLQAQTAGNNLVLTWPLSAADYALETSADLISWTAVPNVPAIVNLQNAVTNPISSGMLFYRLKK